jgi:hypothetical protein
MDSSVAVVMVGEEVRLKAGSYVTMALRLSGQKIVHTLSNVENMLQISFWTGYNLRLPKSPLCMWVRRDQGTRNVWDI